MLNSSEPQNSILSGSNLFPSRQIFGTRKYICDMIASTRGSGLRDLFEEDCASPRTRSPRVPRP